LTPADGAKVSSALPVWLTATGYDPEDGPLDTVAFSWSSDLDGAIGEGNEVLADELSPGWHEITLTAIDSEHNATEGKIGVYVDALPPFSCYGDCGSDGTVTVDELIKAVNVALGAVEVNDCVRADANGDDAVSVDELVKAVNAALSGCTA
jgi:hypothetical protein